MKFFWEVFVTLFVIIDPPGTVPVFLGLTRGQSRRDRNQLAWQATIVAFSVIVAIWLAMRFALVIHRLLTDNGVELVTRIAGLLLAAIAVQLVANSAIAFAHGALFIGPDRSGSCGRKSRRASPTGRNRPMTARIEQVSSE